MDLVGIAFWICLVTLVFATVRLYRSDLWKWTGAAALLALVVILALGVVSNLDATPGNERCRAVPSAFRMLRGPQLRAPAAISAEAQDMSAQELAAACIRAGRLQLLDHTITGIGVASVVAVVDLASRRQRRNR